MATSLNLTEDILPLTDFKRNTGQLAEQMKSTGRPLILTINGRAELVVQDAAAYQALLEAAETLATLESVRRGAARIERGEGVALEEAFQSIRKRRKSK
jgi:prevent-host-death family protein